MTATGTSTPQPSVSNPERTVSAIFKERQQIDDVIRRLLDRGISRDDISVIGKNFHSETKIAGFITKKDVILGGLKQGAIFGSLFGSALALLSGVGVLSCSTLKLHTIEKESSAVLLSCQPKDFSQPARKRTCKKP